MGYTKYHDPWLDSHVVTPEALTHIETQFDEAYSYFLAHGHDDRYFTKTIMESIFWFAGNDGPGSGMDADLIYHSGGNLHAAAFAGMGVPTGLIIMWSGGAAPSGWHLCDGTAGTVDLRDGFVYGAGTGGAWVGDNGSGQHTPTGTITVYGHALTVAEIKGHQHSYNDKYGDGSAGGGYLSGYVRNPGSTTQTGRTTGNSSVGKTPADAHGHSPEEGTAFAGYQFTALPPFYSLAYIQKV